MEINVPVTVPDDFFESIITNAIEGGVYGIGYWFSYLDIKRGRDKLIYFAQGVDAEIDDPSNIDPYKSLTKAHKQEHGDLWTITLKTVNEGLKKALAERHPSIVEAMQSESPECQLDANDADIIIQYGLFGKIVYG